MLKGMYLTLMAGPVVPVPVPQVVLDALTSVQVTTTAGERSVFQLSFTLSNKSPLQTLFLLTGGSSIPILRIILIVTVNGIPNVLMDGVMTKHTVSPGPDAGHSTLTVTGEDLSAVMDFIPFDGFPFPCMPPEARVALIVAKYAIFGMVPLVIPSILTDVPIPVEQIPRQQGTDLAYITQLAKDAGYVFYITPGPAPGMNVAYWGPEIKVGVPQPALNINMDVFTNVESLSFTFSPQNPALTIVWVQEPISKLVLPLPVPDVSLLNPPLGLVSGIPNRIEVLQDVAKMNPIRAVLTGLARASQSSDAVTGSGALDVLRYGHVLNARQLVGVRGAGMAYDGLYYVNSVTHNIKRGEYKQDFSLTRNGLISTFPRVPA
jgi:hypothetical protein